MVSLRSYRGRDARSNAAYAGVDGGRAVYTVAAAAVSLNLTNHTQVNIIFLVGDFYIYLGRLP